MRLVHGFQDRDASGGHNRIVVRARSILALVLRPPSVLRATQAVRIFRPSLARR
jgi:hypothetical protein